MSGTSQPHQTIEFKGHLIDSLTLSKIADHIERLDGSYELNDIRIGVHRQDISSINLTVFAKTLPQLESILDDLKPYGAVPSGQTSVDLAPCLQDGVLPEHAFTLRLPQKVFLNGQWSNIEAGQALTLIVDSAKNTANLKDIADLRRDDSVVIGNHGIEW